MVLAMPVHHPVFPVGADFQLVGFNVVAILGFPGNGTLGCDGSEKGKESQIHLEGRKKE